MVQYCSTLQRSTCKLRRFSQYTSAPLLQMFQLHAQCGSLSQQDKWYMTQYSINRFSKVRYIHISRHHEGHQMRHPAVASEWFASLFPLFLFIHIKYILFVIQTNSASRKLEEFIIVIPVTRSQFNTFCYALQHFFILAAFFRLFMRKFCGTEGILGCGLF